MDNQIQQAIDNGAVGMLTAITSLRPESPWHLDGNDYDGVVWEDSNTEKPTEQEVNDEIVRLKELVQHHKYRNARRDEYPLIEDQLDMLFWDMENDETTWRDAIRTIKNKYPKPN